MAKETSRGCGTGGPAVYCPRQHPSVAAGLDLAPLLASLGNRTSCSPKDSPLLLRYRSNRPLAPAKLNAAVIELLLDH